MMNNIARILLGFIFPRRCNSVHMAAKVILSFVTNSVQINHLYYRRSIGVQQLLSKNQNKPATNVLGLIPFAVGLAIYVLGAHRVFLAKLAHYSILITISLVQKAERTVAAKGERGEEKNGGEEVYNFTISWSLQISPPQEFPPKSFHNLFKFISLQNQVSLSLPLCFFFFFFLFVFR